MWIPGGLFRRVQHCRTNSRWERYPNSFLYGSSSTPCRTPAGYPEKPERILAASVRMMDKTLRRFAPEPGHFQGVRDPVDRHARLDGPTHDLSVKEINHYRCRQNRRLISSGPSILQGLDQTGALERASHTVKGRSKGCAERWIWRHQNCSAIVAEGRCQQQSP